MKWVFFYRSGLLPECWTSSLDTKNGRLYGIVGDDRIEISPADIVEVSEHGFNNPFLLIRTARSPFHVGVLTRQYDDVASILDLYVGSGYRSSFAHRFNAIYYRKQFHPISYLNSLFRKGPTVRY